MNSSFAICNPLSDSFTSSEPGRTAPRTPPAVSATMCGVRRDSILSRSCLWSAWPAQQAVPSPSSGPLVIPTVPSRGASRPDSWRRPGFALANRPWFDSVRVDLAVTTTPADSVFPSELFAIGLAGSGVWDTESIEDFVIASACDSVGGAGFVVGCPATIGPTMGFRGAKPSTGSCRRETRPRQRNTRSAR